MRQQKKGGIGCGGLLLGALVLGAIANGVSGSSGSTSPRSNSDAEGVPASAPNVPLAPAASSLEPVSATVRAPVPPATGRTVIVPLDSGGATKNDVAEGKPNAAGGLAPRVSAHHPEAVKADAFKSLSPEAHVAAAKAALALGFDAKLRMGGDVGLAARHLALVPVTGKTGAEAKRLRKEIDRRARVAAARQAAAARAEAALREKAARAELRRKEAELRALAQRAVTIFVVMAETNANGDAWDGIGAGGPDPFVVVDGVSYRESRCQDNFRCVFEVLGHPSGMNIDVYDADATMDDAAGSVYCAAGQVCDTDAARVIVTR